MMKRSAFLTGLFAVCFFAAMAQDQAPAPTATAPTVPPSPPANVSALKMESTSQGRPGKLSYKQKVQYANNMLQAGNYFDAMTLYSELIQKKPNDDKLIWGTAECERLSRDYKTAEVWYRKLITANASGYPLLYYRYAEVLKMNAKYNEAKSAFNTFISKSNGNSTEARHAKVELDGCDFALAAINSPVDYKITHLDAPLNKPRTEFAPTVLNENTMYYSSINDDSALNGSLMKDKNTLLAHIYTSTKTNGVWNEGKPLPMPVNSDAMHSGYSAVSKDGKRMYFTECSGQGVYEITCKIFLTTLDNNNAWGKPKILGDKVNKPGSDNTQPAVVEGKDDDTLYFASNRAGGKGGYDIYYSVIKRTGAAEEAVNLGDSVNTEWDEKTPGYWPRKGILYFSSNGRVGLGGFDNYYTWKGASGWEAPKNFGYPVNSSADDYGFSIGEDDKALFYFVSNRPGIIGLKSETCCDDIFQAKSMFVPHIVVKGDLIEREDSATRPLEGVKVELYDITSGIPKLITSDERVGKSNYAYNLEPDHKYNMKFQRQGDFPQYQDLNTMGIETSDTLTRNITMDKIITNKAYTLGNIYYEYKSAALNEQSKVTLDTLANLLRNNPGIVIELSSHTDSIGGDEYNQKLSQQRAESCVQYLVTVDKIDSARVIPKGYGRSEPVAPNTINHRDNPEGRAKNRRTQYKVIGNLTKKGDKVVFEASEPPKKYQAEGPKTEKEKEKEEAKAKAKGKKK